MFFTARVKKPTIIETISLNRLLWFGHVERMEENRILKRVPVLYMNLGTTRLRGRPRNRWQGGVREDGRIVGGSGVPRNFFGGVQQIQLRTEDREDGDLGAVAP